MASSNVGSVVKYFSQANEGFSTTTSGTTSSGATTVTLNGVVGLTDGTVFVGIIEPGGAKEQTFTGTVSVSTLTITNVVWTRGTNVAHSTGVTVVDYVTGTHHNMITTGLLKEHTQAGIHALTASSTLTSARVITALTDTNGNELMRVTPTASAVNDITLANAATANNPAFTASGDDTNVGMNFVTKGTGEIQWNGVNASGAWQSWTPTTTGITTGNGVTTAMYKQIGKTVTARYSFTLGTTSAISSGAVPTITLPVTANAAYTVALTFPIGVIRMNDAGNATYIGIVRMASTSTFDIIAQGTAGASATEAGFPFTAGNLDTLSLQITYEAA